MKKEWEKILSAKVSEEARERIFSSADKLLDELHGEKQPGFFERLFSPMGGMALAGAAAVTIVVLTNKGKVEGPMATLEPEMVGNVELLLELETLEQWNPDEAGKQGWNKKAG